MNTLKIIEGHICRFNDYPQRCDCFVAGIIQILQSEIERKRGMKKEYTESFHVDEVEKNQAVKYKNHGEVGFNRCLKEDIAHLTVLLDSLK